MAIGNDLVDLGRPENLARGTNARLHQRVLHACERRLLTQSTQPELTYLKLWSAKEAAFKLLQQSEADLLFAHSRFVVSPKRGQVNFSGKTVAVTWHITGQWLHCIATNTAEDVYQSRVQRMEDWLLSTPFTAAEELSIYSESSRAVRHLVKAMAGDLLRSRLSRVEYDRRDLELLRVPVGRRYSPPQLQLRGKPLRKLAVSLSHDGDYVAAVIGCCAIQDGNTGHP